MIVRRCWINGYRGVDARFDCGSTTVFFGRNDVGKSNLLEAVANRLSPESLWWRRDPAEDEEDSLDDYDGEFLIELGGLQHPESSDLTLLQVALLGEGNTLPDHEVPFALDRDASFPVMPLPYREFIQQFRDGILPWARGRCSPGHWARLGGAYETLLDSRLSSRWLLIPYGAWLPPMRSDLDDASVRAAEVLVREADAWHEGKIPLLQHFAESVAKGVDVDVPALPDRQPQPQLDDEFWQGEACFPFHVIAITEQAASFDSLAQEIEDDIEATAAQLPDPPRVQLAREDFWLSGSSEDGVRVNPLIFEACKLLGERATSIAPAFVSARYVIGIEPLSPIHWRPAGGRRIRFVLTDRNSGRAFNLKKVGSGLAIWAGYAIEAATRELRPPEPAWRSRPGDISPIMDSDGSPIHTFMVIDEPERHLHPLAQEEAARWLVEQVSAGRVSAFLATHSPIFLALPMSDAEYVSVRRDPSGSTRTESLSSDVLGLLSERATEHGVRPVELVQLTRAVLVVEGKHDEAIIRAIFERELAENRVEILPLRGAHEALALVEVEHLARLGKPLIVMLDNTRQSTVEGGEEIRLDSDRSQEEKILLELRALLRDQSVSLDIVPFEPPDIICGLPEDVVRRVLRNHFGVSFEGWDSLVDEWMSQASPHNFKGWVRKRWGVSARMDKIIRLVLGDTPPGHAAPSLNRAMREILSRVPRD